MVCVLMCHGGGCACAWSSGLVRPNIAGVTRMAAVVGMVASLATGCSDRAEVTRVIGGEYRDSTRVLVLTVSSCNADVSADVVETATEVRVTVTAKAAIPWGIAQTDSRSASIGHSMAARCSTAAIAADRSWSASTDSEDSCALDEGRTDASRTEARAARGAGCQPARGARAMTNATCMGRWRTVTAPPSRRSR